MRYRTITTYETDRDLDAGDTAALADALGPTAIVTAGPSRTLVLEHTLEAKNLTIAQSNALFDTAEALAALGVHDSGGRLYVPVAVTVAEADWHAAQTVRAGMPGVVTISEAAPILGVTQQRASKLAATDADFPDPVNPGREPRLYDEQQMRHYAATRPRRAGRPKRTTD
jgi:hypothetical protein